MNNFIRISWDLKSLETNERTSKKTNRNVVDSSVDRFSHTKPCLSIFSRYDVGNTVVLYCMLPDPRFFRL